MKLPFCLICASFGTNSAFIAPIFTNHPLTKISVSILPPAFEQDGFEQDNRIFLVSKENAGALVRFGKGESEKIINSFGLWCAAIAILTGPMWMVAMSTIQRIHQFRVHWDPDRHLFDATGKIWSKVWLKCINCYPTISGDIQQLKMNQGPCLYVANHASWMDIPVLCTVLDQVFKFIAKEELSILPCIGQQLAGGKHILIDREDRRSQLRTFKEGLNWLKRGVPLMAFPEGTRSNDGRLMEFKKGIFSLASKMNVPIVPITLSHTHEVMPIYSLLPIQSGAGKIHVHVNDPILPEGRTEAEIEDLVRQAFLRTLPKCQLPLQLSTNSVDNMELKENEQERAQAA